MEIFRINKSDGYNHLGIYALKSDSDVYIIHNRVVSI